MTRTLLLRNDSLETGNDVFGQYVGAAQNISFDPSTGHLYETGLGAEANGSLGLVLARLDPVNGTPIAETPIPGVPFITSNAIAFDPSLGLVTVAVAETPTRGVLVGINESDGRIVWNRSLPSSTNGLAFDPADASFYVGDGYSDNVTRVAAATGSVLGQVLVPESPTVLAYDPALGEMAIVASGQWLVLISNLTHAVVAHTAVGNDSTALAYDASGRALWIANERSSNVSVLNATTLLPIASVSVENASAIAVDSASGRVFVTGFNPSEPYQPQNVSIIDPTTHGVLANVSVGSAPLSLTFEATLGEVDILSLTNDSITVVSATSGLILGTIPVLAIPYDSLLDPSNGNLYISGFVTTSVNSPPGPGFVREVSGQTDLVLRTDQFAEPLAGETLDPVNGELYLESPDNNSVVVLDAANLSYVTTIAVGKLPLFATFDAADSVVAVSDDNQSSVTEIDPATNAVTATYRVGSDPAGIAADPSTGELFVVDANSSNITELDPGTGRIVRNLTVNAGGGLWAVAVDPRDGYLLATVGYAYSAFFTNGAGALTVFNASTGALVANVLVGADPQAIALEPQLGLIAVADTNSLNVTIVDAATLTVLGNVGVGLTPESLAYNASSNTLAVGNVYAGTLSFVTGTPSAPADYPVTFTETGLPNARPWTVTLGGVVRTSATTSIGFRAVNGTFNYTVNATGAFPTPGVGVLVVHGGPATQAVVFAPEYQIEFTESGLPAGAAWEVAVFTSASTFQTNFSLGTSLWIYEPNGTYDFESFALGSAYEPIPFGAQVTILGAPLDIAIQFAPASSIFTITFDRYGLPASLAWTVEVGAYLETTDGVNVTGAPLAFEELNGTFDYAVHAVPGYDAIPATGAVTIQGLSVVVNVTFVAAVAIPPVYSVSFTEKGLPAGTLWAVSLGPLGTLQGSTVSLAIPLENGTFDYTITAIPGYQAVPSSGSFEVAGHDVTIAIDFSAAATSTSTKPSTGWLGLPGALGLYLVAAVVAAAAFGGVLAIRRGGRSPPAARAAPPPFPPSSG